MTNIEMRVNDARMILTLDLFGHAGFADLGSDIVCAGISTLFYTAVQSLVTLESNGYGLKVQYHVQDGEAHLRAVASDGATWHRMQEYAEVIMTGYSVLARDVPEHVKLKIEN